MRTKTRVKHSLDYLRNKRQIIWWKVVAGPPDVKLSILQEYDVIFDDIDRRIRQL